MNPAITPAPSLLAPVPDTATRDMFPHVDRDQLARELDDLKAELIAEVGDDDRAHWYKMQRWIRGLKVIGYATAWIAPNPLSILALSQAKFSTWGMAAHHVLHKGYDNVEGLPKSIHSTTFAQGPPFPVVGMMLTAPRHPTSNLSSS